jgi:flagellar P-ring protein precursor FlgI
LRLVGCGQFKGIDVKREIFLYILSGLFLFCMIAHKNAAYATRIKDIADIAGVRVNALVGYGLVVGLDGTGDSTNVYKNQTMRKMLSELGINITPDEAASIKLKNTAMVVIHANLPPFAKPGQKIDLTVSSIGDAKSLRGGNLLLTPLKGADGLVYALAQGSLIVGGISAYGQDKSKVVVNIPEVGRIPDGATIERAAPNPLNSSDYVVFNLHDPDFTTAMRMSEAINQLLGGDIAEAIDGTSVKVSAPLEPSRRVQFLATLENMEFTPANAAAKVVINSRTGTIVIGKEVRIAQAAISHGNLSVTVTENTQVSQPNPFSFGTTQVVQQSNVNINKEHAPMYFFDSGATLEQLVRAVNAVGVAPSDLEVILEALKEAGAISAQVTVI